MKDRCKKLIYKFSKYGLRRKEPEKSFKKMTIETKDRRCKSAKLKDSAELKIRIGGEAQTPVSQQISRISYLIAKYCTPSLNLGFNNKLLFFSFILQSRENDGVALLFRTNLRFILSLITTKNLKLVLVLSFLLLLLYRRLHSFVDNAESMEEKEQ